MVISDSHRFIFLAVPKAGSSSIEAALAPYTSELTSQFNKHATVLKLKRDLPPEIWNGYFKFAFVRNPYDRIESWYYYRQRRALADPNHPHHDLYTGDKTFAEFAQWFPRHDMIFKQTDFIAPHGGGLLVDQVYRFENLHNEFSNLCSRLLLPPLVLPKIRASERQAKEQSIWNAASRRIVNEYFAEDFAMFDYPVMEA
jgi:hypothetical protein